MGKKYKLKFQMNTNSHQKRLLIKTNWCRKIRSFKITGKIIGGLLLILCIYLAISHPNTLSFQFITPNFLNLSLLALALISHGSIIHFLTASESAISGTVGILLQFPLYFGIMGIFQSTGIIQDLSHFFQHVSSEFTYPYLHFFQCWINKLFCS